MATRQILQSDIDSRLGEALRRGRLAASLCLSAAEALQAIQTEGEALIAAMLQEYRLAIAAKLKPSLARPVLRAALAAYVEAAEGWMASGVDLVGPGRRLRESLEQAMRIEAAMVAGGAVMSGVRWSRGGVIAAIAVGAISIIVVLGGIDRNSPAAAGAPEAAQHGQ